MAISFSYKENTIQQGLDRMATKLGAMLLMYASTKASELQAKMKQNRPWTDRTGMAKATLNTKVSQPDDHTIRITLAHGVDHGIWLELANEKNYAIVGPTVQQEGPRVVSDLHDLMTKIEL